MSPFQERIKKLIEHFDSNPNAFAKGLGLDPNSFRYSISERVKDPGTSLAIAILKKYPQINAEWLIKGEGEMLKAVKRDQPGGDKEIIVETVDASGNPAPVIVYAEAYADYLHHNTERAFIQSLPVMSAPFLKGGGDYRAFQIKGDSMEPTFYAGDFAFSRRIYSPNEINSGHVHIIMTQRDGIVCKRMIPHRPAVEEGSAALYKFIELRSDNHYYEPYMIEWSDVIEIWYPDLRLTKEMPPPTKLNDRVFTLEKEMFEVKRHLFPLLPSQQEI